MHRRSWLTLPRQEWGGGGKKSDQVGARVDHRRPSPAMLWTPAGSMRLCLQLWRDLELTLPSFISSRIPLSLPTHLFRAMPALWALHLIDPDFVFAVTPSGPASTNRSWSNSCTQTTQAKIVSFISLGRSSSNNAPFFSPFSSPRLSSLSAPLSRSNRSGSKTSSSGVEMISNADIGPEAGSGKGEEYDRPFAFSNVACEGRGVIMGIGTGSAYSVAKFRGNSSGVPGIGEADEESKAGTTRPLGPLMGLVAFVAGLGVGVGFSLGFRVGENSVGTDNPHLGRKHDVIPTADASGRSRSTTLLLRVLLLSAAVVVGCGSRIPGIKDVARDGGGVIGRLLPALAGSEAGPSPIRLRKNNFLAIPLPIPKLGGVRLLKTDPRRPLDFHLAVTLAGLTPKVNAASELEWWR